MKLGDLSDRDVGDRLGAAGLALDLGLVKVRIQSNSSHLVPSLRFLYGEFPVSPGDGFFDVTARLRVRRRLTRPGNPQAAFQLDGEEPFEPFPLALDMPLLEWGLNWAIATRVRWALLLHGGAVERAGVGVVLPAVPGSGKSTLTAALSSRGYRLLSDEFAAVRLGDGELLPALRPIALKNESIEVIRRFAPQTRLGPLYPGTRKGDVVHAAPDAASVAARATPAVPALVVFPRYEAGAATALRPFSHAQAFARLGVNSFNYAELGPLGFDAVRRLVERCECHRLVFSSLEEAIGIIDALVDRIASGGTLRDVAAGGQSVESSDAFRGISNTATP